MPLRTIALIFMNFRFDMMPRIFYSLILWIFNSRLTACSGCPLFDIATNKAMGQYQTSNSRLKRGSRKRVIFIWSPSFFCQRDYSRRAGISKQQAFGASHCWQIPSRRLNSKQAEERRGMFPQWFSFWYDIWPSFWYDRAKIWPSFW